MHVEQPSGLRGVVRHKSGVPDNASGRDAVRFIAIIATAIAMSLGATSAPAQDWQDFPPYPGSKELCRQRAYGGTREVHWAAFTSGDPPQAVAAFYESRLGKPESARNETRFAMEKGGTIERVLSVHPVDGSYPRCGRDPEPGDRTVLIISRAVAR